MMVFIMNIQRIQASNPSSTFKAGKVRVFSDFDKTFLPARHKDFVRNYDKEFIDGIKKYFKNFSEFLNQTKDGLKFTITTGRTFGEFLTLAEAAREREFGMPLPDTLIVKNGGDEHTRVGTDEDFYNGGSFPFKYEVTNKEKESKIKQISGWDGTKVKQILKDIFKSYNFRIVEADSEHSVKDYGPRSLFYQGNLPYEDKKVFQEDDRADWSVGFRNDGNLKVFYTLPVDMEKVEERYIILQDILNKSKEKFNAEGFKIVLDKHKKLHCRPCVTLEPQTNGSQNLTKVYDVQESVKEATRNNDLVIVAGDGSNDKEMLNPGEYLRNYLPENILKKYGGGIAFTEPDHLIEILDKDSELAEMFIKMPFRGIIVRQIDGENELSELEPFAKGKYQKLVIVDSAKLQQGIKDSIKQYAEQNPKYKEKLNSNLKKQIESDSSHKGDDSGNGGNDGDGNNGGAIPESSNTWKYILGVLTALGIGGGVYLWNKNKKKRELKNVTTNQHNLKSV